MAGTSSTPPVWMCLFAKSYISNTSDSAAVKTIGGRPDGTQISQVGEKCPSKSLTAALGVITQLLSRNRMVP